MEVGPEAMKHLYFPFSCSAAMLNRFRGVAHPLCPISANPLENSHGPKESEQRNLEIELQKLKLMIASLVEKLTASEARVAQLESCLI